MKLYTECFRKKHGVGDYRYFTNGNTLHCNIFRYNKYNFHLDVCEISNPYVKRTAKVMNLRIMMGNGLSNDKFTH